MKPLIAVTGASSGIGAAIAKLFSDKGYPLLLMARRLERMEEPCYPESICKKVDVRNVEEIRAAVQEAQEKYGPVDCMINNAGVICLDDPWTQSLEEWERMVDINIKGVMNGIHVVLPGMVDRKGGTIINISSLAGRKPFARHMAYCGTKYAVHGITETLRLEVAKFNVRAIVIAPASTATEIISHTSNEKYRNDWKENAGDLLDPMDVAASIAYAYEQPQRVCVREIVICPTTQPD
ncbi:MAG: SDR family oxidoreductase [Chloroflexi bacterium]|nr:SDR family oxidoreductase [Chloroflexota bacterium]